MNLRFLVACPHCKLQHDAGTLAPGSVFHCSCGTLLSVPRGGVHDASVVRCSLCGAAKPLGEADCSFCGGEFTLHEKDLDTVCASCLARVSGQARYCHSCGLALVVGSVAGAATDQYCPVCDNHQLHSRPLSGGDFGVLECVRCAGLWLSQQGFSVMVEKVRESAVEPVSGQGAIMAPQINDRKALRQGGKLYRKCPECSKLMNRSNYGRYSGVLIDSCSEHGIWFDHAELDTILSWVKAGGEKRAMDYQREESDAQARVDRRKEREAVEPVPLGDFSSNSPSVFESPLLAGLYYLGRLFFRGFW